MRNFKVALVAILAMVLTACASTPFSPIKMDNNFYQNNNTTIGVYMVAPEKVDTYLIGASCLVCYAAAAAANNALTKHIQTMDVSDFTEVKAELVKMLQDKGQTVVLVEQDLKLSRLKKSKSKTAGFAEQDFTALKSAAGVDKLLVVQIDMLGAQRLYNGYIPTSAPTGAVSGKLFMVDLSNNKLELDQRISEFVAVEGEWDEPTQFPGVTTAYFRAVEQAKSFIKQQL